MSDAFLRVLNAPTGDDIAVARMWEQYDFDASEWDADSDSETDSDVTVDDWETDHDDNVFVSATLNSSRRGFAPEANVAAIGRPKMAYPDVEKLLK